MNNLSRRSFMKGLAGVVAGVSVLKAAEPKEQNVELTAYGSKEDEGKIIAGLERGQDYRTGCWRPSAGIDPNSDWAIALEDIPKGQYGWIRVGYDEKTGDPWVKPVHYKDFYVMPKNGVKHG